MPCLHTTECRQDRSTAPCTMFGPPLCAISTNKCGGNELSAEKSARNRSSTIQIGPCEELPQSQFASRVLPLPAASRAATALSWLSACKVLLSIEIDLRYPSRR